MSIGITDEHVELAASTRKWAASLAPLTAVRAAEGDPDARFDDVWGAIEEMGVHAIGVPEAAGGGGGTVLDQAVALEACAHELLPGGLLGAAVGSLVRGVPGRHAVQVRPGGAVWDGGGTLGIDLSARHADADAAATAATVGPGSSGGEADRVRLTAVTLAAAEASGVARWCLDTAVEHARVREQFGRPIGSFQAVKHLCAEMLETAEAVTAAAWDAACAADGHTEQWSYAVDVAQAVCFDGAVEVAKSCIQVLGGIGFTFEHDAHLYLRRALSLRSLVGPSDVAAARLTAAAVAGVRRRVEVDLGGHDEHVRPQVRATVERVAALPDEARRAALAEAGYLAPHWPAPHGLGADPVTQLVIDQELARAGIERPDLVIAGWALPTILQHGTDAQRERFVRPSLLGELLWCQLFSEPGSGSDLASLRTRATRVDGGWSLSGQKVWTSMAERADWAICLARTDPDVPQHQGITYFLVDMRSPGIEVRPLREITGRRSSTRCSSTTSSCPTTASSVGPVTAGGSPARPWPTNGWQWRARGSARASNARSPSPQPASSRWWRHGSATRSPLSTVCSLLGVRTTLRALGGHGPGAESSVAKLLGVRSRQSAAELVVELQGDAIATAGAPDRDDEGVAADVWELLNTRCLSIAGGTTQILRNVAGERILGLPR
ncbi:acyl-CoA dehydrogenase family protein [Nocardioides sp. TF02-7]|uniref:acyl-CoA dehydrogenase family protein n=1 Tax=Nocardioides sp. TF02-7 TaxID=2917724 RepID=UPI001F06CDA2|nr:acyl-CoA dehydrogenase family protein [Nocardioides sp. TF02-7]UMG92329.1 acyl-CoA dehydrogenase family protein [Nocardioides sp. TF02-7]